MDSKKRKEIARRILGYLYDHYFELGYKSETYQNSETGGIYENKVANTMGFELIQGDRSPPDFIEGCRLLQQDGYVIRMKRSENPELGIWPTKHGLEHLEYERLSVLQKSLHHVTTSWPRILIDVVVAVVITFASLAVGAVFGWFGLGN